MGDLSQNFSTSEFVCKCGCNQVEINYTLVNALQELRNSIKNPIVITSGFRCELHNKAVGGSKHSYHLTGKAADIQIPKPLLKDAYLHVMYIKDFQNGGIGLYPQNNFIHVDVRGKTARWSMINGVQKSIVEGLSYLGDK